MKRICKLSIVIFIIVLSLTGCDAQERIKPEEKNFSNLDELRLVYEQMKKLDEIDGIDEVVAYVENLPITRRKIEETRLFLKEETIKGAVDSLTWEYAAKAEAERLKIYPPQKKIDAYFEQTTQLIETKAIGTETICMIMDVMEISIDEYLKKNEEVIYNLYQREELWKHISKEDGSEDKNAYDTYFDSLMKNAKVEFKDKQIKEAYVSGK
ncbi:MAG: hypothetical protein J6A69_03805 [Clostridia bacterium]|nr:hypothetical protein [Clostridia bacterium]